MRHRPSVVVTVAVVQALTTIALTVFVFGAGMARWDTGAPQSIGVTVANHALNVLSLPLLPFLAKLPPGTLPSGFPWDHLYFLCNGLCWGLVALALLRLWRARRSTGEHK